MSEKLLEVQNLKTYFTMHGYTVRAVDGVDFHVNRGETLGIVGESGCGKSQTSMSIMRLVPDPPGKIVDGKVLFRGQNLLQLREQEMRQIRGNDISMIFQEPMTSLNPVYTIGYQISEVLMLHRDMGKKEALAESARLLAEVGISDPAARVHEYPFQLSGGLRQRVMIAMAMACEPALMIADEPTTALDVTIQAQILRLMRRLKHERDTAIMFITHDLAVIANFSERVMVMYAGVVVETTTVQNIFKRAMHPYTQGLLGSVPVLGESKFHADGTRRLLQTIPGTLPDPKRPPSGCRFADRCPRAMPKCFQNEPALMYRENGHQVRCFLYGDEIRSTGESDE
ncbi:ABC transporter ATP-binding protein [Spirochaeta africana]|uniref:Oligopeptide/dipeptide ABC transporter, ATP-binding protein n=1 Tax=Spirochaeta africana (strain ATCC 700263 / DSM 8902 / Z-7692) TaxID=889378 RepID=H9UML0_SPIAZ|nr:ABC transporter ATP-binding protein [Spirochaeta africana]AFG38753.1 oligopeptide/dipeptide ABC transporter, ATP-binding protein [Spirochaeta africana DSM 8902]